MTLPRTYVLVAIWDNSLFAQWSFVAPTEFAVAERILQTPFSYEKLFWGLRLSMEHAHDMDPRKLLERIHGSYHRNRAIVVFHLFALDPVVVPVPAEAADVHEPRKAAALLGSEDAVRRHIEGEPRQATMPPTGTRTTRFEYEGTRMASGTFGSLEEAGQAYQIVVRQEPFIVPVPRPVDERFRERLEFLRANAPVSASEEAICEFLIAPVLQELWLPYSDKLMIWSHVAFTADATLTGFPDYFFARRSPLGPYRDKPYVLFVEAKKDNFDAGWGQCLSAMLAAQRLNDRPDGVIHGGVSNGRVWELGKLVGRTLTQDPRPFVVSDLPALFAALNYGSSDLKIVRSGLIRSA